MTRKASNEAMVRELGATPLIEQHARQAVTTQAWGLVDEVVLSILEGLAGLAALAFYFLRPREREYLWFGVMLLSSASVRCFSNWAQSHRIAGMPIRLSAFQLTFSLRRAAI